MTSAVPPLVLRNGVTIEDPLTTALEFIAQDSSYQKYDLAPVARDNRLTIEDIQIANWMIARMSREVIEGIFARARVINEALAEVPTDSTLAARDDGVPWDGLLALMRAIEGAPAVGLARATKVLHKKRPALIPILDSVLEKYLRRVDQLRRTGDFAVDAVALMRSYKRELDATLPALRTLRRELSRRYVELSEVRLLDLFLWGYSGTYTPLYLRDVSAAPAASSPRGTGAPARRVRPEGMPDGSIELFRDDDDGYLQWLANHAHGFVLNAARSPRPEYLVLHRAACRTINGVPARGGPWTGPYIKVCADDAFKIVAWAGAAVGAAPRRCGICRPAPDRPA